MEEKIGHGKGEVLRGLSVEQLGGVSQAGASGGLCAV